jgi:NAD(P)H-dependent flavin oxidoreductase YrpB (nitropropane dioxygenase family)
MAIRTRLTEFFGLQHPIVLAPMTPAAGADLASAVSEAGGLGPAGWRLCRASMVQGGSRQSDASRCRLRLHHMGSGARS